MPQCSTCHRDLQRKSFSRAQLGKASQERRCKECVERGITISTSQPSSAAPSSHEPPPADFISELVGILLGRRHALSECLRNELGLCNYLQRVFFGERFQEITWLLGPLYMGLLKGGPLINVNVNPDPSHPLQGNFSILMWVCQWHLLGRQFGWEGRDELVAMVLGTPGVRVNYTMPNKVNAAFLAVKYGSPETLKLLVNAGINMQQRDCFDRTMLYNALEYPHPEMIRIILEHNPATEMFGAHELDGSNVTVSAADRIWSLYGLTGTIVTEGQQIVNELFSWVNRGAPPPVEDVAESLIMVRQRGSTFTAEGCDFTFGALGNLYKGIREFQVRVRQHEDFLQLALSVLGFWLPPVTKDRLLEGDSNDVPSSDDAELCTICLGPFNKAATLYCRHVFCRKCIVDYSANDGTACPVCRVRLCRELAAPATDTTNVRLDNRSGSRIELERELMRKLPALTDAQLTKETMAQGIFSRRSSYSTLRDKLMEMVVDGHTTAKTRNPVEFSPSGSTEERRRSDCSMTLELSANTDLLTSNMMLRSPSDGPVMVEIMLRGIPVVAQLSNNSRYTSVSSTVVETFGLKRLEGLSSREFRDALSAKRINMNSLRVVCLEKFEFSLGGVEIALRNAVEVDPDMNGVGIKLGQDFFFSGAFCAVDVKIGKYDATDGSTGPDGGDCYMRTDGLYAWVTTTCNKESLRYYSNSGKSVHLPLLHFDPNRDLAVQALALKWDATFNECHWCTRVFPDGMRQCPVCLEVAGHNIYYCDEECQAAAWKIHKSIRTAHGGER